MPWFDSHCHLPDVAAGATSPADVLRAAREAGVRRLVTVGTDAEQSRLATELARDHEEVWATVGLHPHEATLGVDTIVSLLGGPRVVAVGECGLDYHYDHSPRPVQREAFAAQVALARERGLALVIHSREAWDDTLSVLAAEGPPERTIFHCFTGGPGEARRCLDLGGYLSFSGIVTFKRADDVRAAARLCPPDRLLVETDAPYLAPVPRRGRPNEPALVPLVGDGVAAAKGVTAAEVEESSWAAAHSAFDLQGPHGAP